MKARQWATLIVGLLFVGIASSLAAFGDVSAAVVFMCAGILAALYPRMGALVEISLGPLTAKLERNVQESERLLGQLRSTAIRQARFSLETAVRTRGSPSRDDFLYNALKETERSLRALPAEKGEIEEATEPAISAILADFAGSITGGDARYVEVPGEARRAREEIWRNRKAGGDPDAIESWVKRWLHFSPKHHQSLEEMRWIRDNRTVRDVEQFRLSYATIVAVPKRDNEASASTKVAGANEPPAKP